MTEKLIYPPYFNGNRIKNAHAIEIFNQISIAQQPLEELDNRILEYRFHTGIEAELRAMLAISYFPYKIKGVRKSTVFEESEKIDFFAIFFDHATHPPLPIQVKASLSHAQSFLARINGRRIAALGAGRDQTPMNIQVQFLDQLMKLDGCF